MFNGGKGAVLAKKRCRVVRMTGGHMTLQKCEHDPEGISVARILTTVLLVVTESLTCKQRHARASARSDISRSLFSVVCAARVKSRSTLTHFSHVSNSRVQLR